MDKCWQLAADVCPPTSCSNCGQPHEASSLNPPARRRSISCWRAEEQPQWSAELREASPEGWNHLLSRDSARLLGPATTLPISIPIESGISYFSFLISYFHFYFHFHLCLRPKRIRRTCSSGAQQVASRRRWCPGKRAACKLPRCCSPTRIRHTALAAQKRRFMPIRVARPRRLVVAPSRAPLEQLSTKRHTNWPAASQSTRLTAGQN